MPRQILFVLSFAAGLLTATKSPAAEPLPLPSAVSPPASAVSGKSAHLLKAAEHLEAAGLPEQAAHFRKEAERARLREEQVRNELQRKLAELDQIRRSVYELRKEIGAPQQIALKLQILEVDLSHPKLAEIRERMPRREGGSAAAAAGSGILLAAAEMRDEAGTDQPSPAELARIIEGLRAAGALKVVAEPQLITLDGRAAELLSGGEFPVPVPQPDGSVTMEWREFGLHVEALAHTLGNERVRLDITASVADRDYSRCVRVGELFPGISVSLVPGLTMTRAHSQMEVRLGRPTVVGGLIKSAEAGRGKTAESRKVETVIIVTPEAYEPALAPPG